jgi:hypothetical protein
LADDDDDDDDDDTWAGGEGNAIFSTACRSTERSSTEKSGVSGKLSMSSTSVLASERAVWTMDSMRLLMPAQTYLSVSSSTAETEREIEKEKKRVKSESESEE